MLACEPPDVYMLQTRLQDINEIYDIIKSDADVLSIYERKQINKVDGHRPQGDGVR